MLNASANDLYAELISPGTGTAWGRVRVSVGLGVISFRVAKKEERSGRRGWGRGVFAPLLRGVVECSTVIY